MKALIISLFIIFTYAGCSDESITCIDCNTDQIIPPKDEFSIQKVEISEGNLLIDVEYSGGCENHDFIIDWPEAIIAIYPPNFSVVLYHNSNGDLCEALIKETLTFDISESGLVSSDQAINEATITVINGSNPDQKVSN